MLLWKAWPLFQKLNIESPKDMAIPLAGIHPKRTENRGWWSGSSGRMHLHSKPKINTKN
jgi:hypothetical protein